MQKGFSPLYVVLAVVVLVALSGGFYAIRRRDHQSTNSYEALTREVDTTVANGTPENAVNAVTEQVAAEITAEDTALKMEEEATELDQAYMSDLEAVADESNL